MATVSNLFIDQGSDFTVVVTLKSQEGTVLNLTGYTLQSQFRKSYQSSAYTSFTTSIENAILGKIRLSLPASASSSIKAGRYLYDVEVTSPTGAKKRALEGIVVISPEITR